MAKLVLRESCYSGLKNVKKCTAKNKPEHENLVKEANKRIEEKTTLIKEGKIDVCNRAIRIYA